MLLWPTGGTWHCVTCLRLEKVRQAPLLGSSRISYFALSVNRLHPCRCRIVGQPGSAFAGHQPALEAGLCRSEVRATWWLTGDSMGRSDRCSLDMNSLFRVGE